MGTDRLLAALAEPARWRLVNLLAETPRSVTVLAQLAGARRPQTTKHLQTLQRAGLVSSKRRGSRRIYSLNPSALKELAAALSQLAEAAADPPPPTHTTVTAACHNGHRPGRRFPPFATNPRSERTGGTSGT